MFKVTRVMLSEEEIKAKVYEIAKKIEKDYQGEDLLIVGILKGASWVYQAMVTQLNLLEQLK